MQLSSLCSWLAVASGMQTHAGHRSLKSFAAEPLALLTLESVCIPAQNNGEREAEVATPDGALAGH
jgi:hypothetical protein